MHESEKAEIFIRLLAEHERRVATYVMTLMPNWNDAEDVLQEAKVAMWREFEQFEVGTNFGAWACRIAFYRVLAHRKKRQRDRLKFSDAFLEAVSEQTLADQEHLQERSGALSACIQKLNEEHRQVLQLRYFEGLEIEHVASRVGRTLGAVYRLLSRIRHQLHDCIQEKLSAEVSRG